MATLSWEWGCAKPGLIHPPAGHTAYHIPTIPSWHKLDHSAARNSVSGFREPRVASRSRSSPGARKLSAHRSGETWRELVPFPCVAHSASPS